MARDEGRERQRDSHTDDEREEDDREFEMAREHREQFDPVRWQRDIERKRQFGEVPPPDWDPGPEAAAKLQKAIGTFLPSSEASAKVAPARNPPDKGSFGFVGIFAEISADSSFLPGTLVLRFDRQRLRTISADTLRLFRWDDRTREYRLIERSGVGTGGDYVWGRITEPGIYAIIGLDTHPLVLGTIRALHGMRHSLRLIVPAQRQAIVERICFVILCPPEQLEFEPPERLERLLAGEGMDADFPPPRDWRPIRNSLGGDICEICLGLGSLERFLPETQLFGPPGPIDLPSCRDSGWQSVGPRDLAGCILDIALDPTDNDRLYAAANDGGLWRLNSIRGYPATLWRPLTDRNDTLICAAVAIAPTDARIIYLADGLGRLLRSDDRGGSWRVVSGTVNLNKVRRIVVRPDDPETVFIASNAGLWGSTTGGTTWNANPGQSTLRDGDVTDVVMDPDDPSILFIGVKTVGVERSDDAGASFNTVLPWSRASSPSSQMIKIATGRLGSVSTRVVAAKLGQNVFVSRHGGRAPDATGGGAWEWVGLVGGTGYGDWCHVIAVDPFDDNVLLVGAQTLFRVTLSDGAVTEVVDFYEPHEDQQRIVFDPTQAGVVYLANDGGVFRSTDGGITWYSPDRASEVRAKRDLNDGLVTAQFFRVGVAGTNAVGNLMHSGVIATDRLPSGRWLPAEGHGWEFANVYGDPRRFEYFYLLEATLARRRYPGTGSGDLIVTWGNFRPTAIAVDQRPASQTILAASFDPAITLWRTLDGSVPAPAWTAETVPGLSDRDGFIVAIVFAPSEPGMAYILTQAGRVWQKSDVNSDAEWEYRGASSVIARDLAVNSVHADRLYIAGQYEALRSPNGGADWTPIPGRVPHELPSTELNSIVEYPGAGDVVVIGAASGVYITHDEGGEWHPYDDDLPNAEVLQVFWRGRYLYAVTYGRGLWRRRACL